MIFESTRLRGVYVLETEWVSDERGGFGRTFDADEFRTVGANPKVEQCSLSRNPKKGTLRGLHLQREPHGESKVVRCARGEIFDVAVDLRVESPTFGMYHSVHLSDDNGLALVIPPGVAHGFLTIRDNCDVTYQMSVPYVAESAAGIRFDDPEVGIAWPVASTLIVSDRDRNLPSLAAWRRSHEAGEVPNVG